MLGEDPALGSAVLGVTTWSDEPATEDGIDTTGGDDADAATDRGPDLPQRAEPTSRRRHRGRPTQRTDEQLGRAPGTTAPLARRRDRGARARDPRRRALNAAPTADPRLLAYPAVRPPQRR